MYHIIEQLKRLEQTIEEEKNVKVDVTYYILSIS